MVKGAISVKYSCEIEKRYLIEKLLKIPVIENCECISSSKNEFCVLIQYENGVENTIRVVAYETMTPRNAQKAASEIKSVTGKRYTMIMAPYISDKTEQVCIDNGIGYADLSGNILLSIGTLYLSEKGNPNKYPSKRKSNKVFNASSTKTLLILRKLFEDTAKSWKLKNLAEEVGCSIGMVAKVKEKLCEQMWTEMTPDGLKLIDPRGLLDEWGREYKHRSDKTFSCYTLEPLPMFEKKVSALSEEYGIECCLTGLAGGTRYAPVVRYNRTHVLVGATDIDYFMKLVGCKQVDSGANVVLIQAETDQMDGVRTINGNLVASPTQVFLDCLQIKGRGREMADAIYEKEIKK